MPYVLMVHRIQIYVLPPQCLTPVLLLKQCCDCFSFQICFWSSLQIYVLSLFIVVSLIFKRYPWGHLSNAAHKFLYLWTQRASLSCRFPEQLLERRKGVDLGAMLNIKREPRTVVSSELNWDELTSSSTQFEWVKRSGVQNFWNCHLISTVTALVLSRNPTTLDEQMSAGVSKV